MMQTKKEIELWEMFWVTRAYTLKTLGYVKKESYIIIDGRPQSPLLTIICWRAVTTGTLEGMKLKGGETLDI
jgi:hypothetical protein